MIKNDSGHFAQTFWNTIDRAHVFQIYKCIKVSIDELDETFGGNVNAGVFVGQQSSDALEHEAGFSGQKVKWYNESVFDSFFVVLHAGDEGSGLKERSNAGAFAKEVASTIDFEFFVGLRALSQGIENDCGDIGRTDFDGEVEHVDNFSEKLTQELFDVFCYHFILGLENFRVGKLTGQLVDLIWQYGQQTMDQVMVVVGALLHEFVLENEVALFGELQEKVEHVEFCHWVPFFDVENVWVHVADESQNSAGVFVAADGQLVCVFQWCLPQLQQQLLFFEFVEVV